MENSHKFYNNQACQYFPCHSEIEPDQLNCMFCYCPLYLIEKCGGTPTYFDNGKGRMIKDCSGCLLPHQPDSWEKIIAVLTARVYAPK